MSGLIAIVDYGMGNLRSVQKALEKVGARTQITSDPETVRGADKVLLPGVGAFRDAMTELQHLNMTDALKDFAATGRPLLGVCLGLQLIMDESTEGGLYQGLGLVPGRVVRFDDNMEAGGKRLKVPHMGWNAVSIRQPNALTRGVDDGTFFYFVHSYYVQPSEAKDVALVAEHGIAFCAMVARDNVYATQFHPEKSQEDGLRVYRNFVEL
jgi:glutamine amidotransferase